MTEGIIRDRRKRNFVIVDHSVLLDNKLSDAAFRLYCMSLKHADAKGGHLPAIERLASDMNEDNSTINHLLLELEQRGLISRCDEWYRLTED